MSEADSVVEPSGGVAEDGWRVGPWDPVAAGVYVAVAEPEAVNLGLVVGRTGALLVDCGSSPEHGAAIRASAEELVTVPIVAVAVTHAHYDHAYGLVAFADVETVAHESVGVRLAGLGQSVPSRDLAVATALDLGDRRVEIAHLGRGHTEGDLVVVVGGDDPTGADVVFVGDLVESAGPPAYGPDSFGEEWAATLDGVIGLLGARSVAVPGHGPVVDREFVFEARGRIGAVAGEIRRLASEGVPVGEALAAGSWPYPAEALAEAVTVGYAQLGVLGRRANLPLA